MADRTCPICLRPSERKLFCYECLPPLAEWSDPKAYNASYQLLYRMAGLHPVGGFPVSRLPADHPARVRYGVRGPRGTCRYCGGEAPAWTCRSCKLERGRQMTARWAASEEGKRARQQWRRSDKGKEYKRRHGQTGKAHHDYLRARDGDNCQLCGKRIDFTLPPGDKRSATVDHIVPRSQGGTHDWANLQLAHHGCNSSKGTRPLGEQMRLVG